MIPTVRLISDALHDAGFVPLYIVVPPYGTVVNGIYQIHS